MNPPSIEQQLADEVARRKAAEEQAEAANSLIEAALQAINAGTFVWHANTNAAEWSPGFLTLHGFDSNATDVSFDDIVTRIAQGTNSPALNEIRAARKRGAPFDVTYQVRVPDGVDHWIQARGSWSVSADGHRDAVFGIALDADPRMAAQQRLEESERRLQEAQVAGGVGIWDYDFTLGEAYVSDEYLRMHGFDRSHYSIEHYREFVPPEDLKLQAEALQGLSVEQPEYEVEHRLTHAQTGEVHWVLGRGLGHFDQAGNLVRVVGTTQDITERKRTEKVILDSVRVFETFTQASPTLIFLVNKDGKAIFFNDQRWQEFTGRPPESWRGTSWVDAVHPEDREIAVHAWAQALSERTSFQQEFRWQHINGDIRWLLVHALPLQSDDGFAGFVGTGMDMTALKASEQESTELQRALADSNKLEAIGTLASGVAHDFNNLLAGVRGFVELGQLEVAQDSMAAQYLEKALTVVDQAKDVTSGLLTFARRNPPKKHPVALYELIVETTEFLRQLTPAGIQLNTTLEASELTAFADPAQLRQVLINLAINARDSIPAGGTITISLEERNHRAVIGIRDTGLGMDAATRDRVFEPFFTTKNLRGGTGLGLSIVHGIVSAHEGSIRIESEPGRGTLVEVTLPLSQQPTELPAETEAPAMGRGELVLVVEDNELVLESCLLRLQAGGYNAIGAVNSRSAMGKIAGARKANAPFSAYLLDVDLPDQDGVILGRSISHAQPDALVVYITGNAQNPALKDVHSEAVLAKPVNYSTLFTLMQKALAERSDELA